MSPKGERSQEALGWALVFFLLTAIAGLFGFGGIAIETARTAQALFYAFLILFVVALVRGLARRRA